MAIHLVLAILLSSSVQAISLGRLYGENCTADSIPCGPGTECCPSGYICNFNRGIPACESTADPLISGFDGPPCVDPYLYSCSFLGIPGYCCPIGTVCLNDGLNSNMVCVNAYGTTTSAYPSATVGFTPSETSVASNDPSIAYNPPSAWNSSHAVPNCASSNTLHTTSTINATISFNYTGPSIIIHTVTSLTGGVFSVIVDGFNTSDTIDTFAGGDSSLPLCYPVQFPPFHHPPPNLASQNNHTITLTYTGPSPNAPNGTLSNNVQFDSFAIPVFGSTKSNSSQKTNGLSSLLFVLVVCSLFAW